MGYRFVWRILVEYTTLEAFKKDVELVRSNAEKYNGVTSYLAEQARGIEKGALENLAKYYHRCIIGVDTTRR